MTPTATAHFDVACVVLFYKKGHFDIVTDDKTPRKQRSFGKATVKDDFNGSNIWMPRVMYHVSRIFWSLACFLMCPPWTLASSVL